MTDHQQSRGEEGAGLGGETVSCVLTFGLRCLRDPGGEDGLGTF